MLVTLNMAVAALAIMGAIVAARGYLPWLVFRGKSSSAYLARGLVICAVATFPRRFIWDLIWSISPDHWLFSGVGVGAINLLSNAVLLLGIWHILYARLLTISVLHRHRYNIFTAAGYPGCAFRRFRRSDK